MFSIDTLIEIFLVKEHKGIKKEIKIPKLNFKLFKHFRLYSKNSSDRRQNAMKHI